MFYNMINNTPSYFDSLRKSVGYNPSVGTVGDWTKGSAYSLATETSERDDDFISKLFTIPYLGIAFDADARTAYLTNMNRGLLMDDKDRMMVAARDKERALRLIDIINNTDVSDDDKLKLISTSEDYTGLLRDGKFDSSVVSENVNKLHLIIKEASDDYNSAFEEYLTDLEDLQRWQDSHTISGYYTRKSLLESKFGNWYYTQPAQMGLSDSSWKYQASSIAAGLAGGFVFGKAGAAIGTAIAPGVGTAFGAGIGTLIGGIGGAITAQFAGGAKAREQESHIEAYDAYQQNLSNIINDRGIDTSAAVKSIREQAKELGYGSAFDKLPDDEVLALTAADTRFKLDFDNGLDIKKALDDAYVDTRRVYERNNALGAGEFVTDILLYTPLKGFGILSKGAKMTSKLNPLNKLLNVTRKTSINVAELSSAMRNRAIKNAIKQIALRRGIDFVQESTEEGAQHIIQNEFLQGKYAGEQASDSWIDALLNGNMLADIGENFLYRGQSGLQWLGFGSEYKNDRLLNEEMWAGGLMSLFSLPGSVFGAKEIHQSINEVKHAYGMGKYIQEALSKNADIGGLEAFYRNMRKYGFADASSYQEVLDFLREELKSATTSKDGHTTRKYKFDTDAISKIQGPINRNLKDEDGNPIQPTTRDLTDEDIDAFIDELATYARNLFAIKKNVLDKIWKNIQGSMTKSKTSNAESDKMNSELKNVEKQLEENSNALSNDATLDKEQRKSLEAEKKKLENKKKDLTNRIKAGSKQQIDTNLQDAWYALATMSYVHAVQSRLQNDAANESIEKLLKTFESKTDYQALIKSLGFSDEFHVDHSELFRTLHQMHMLTNLKMFRNIVYGSFLAAQRGALHGDVPISLSKQQTQALEKIDARIAELLKSFNNSAEQLLIQVPKDSNDEVKLKALLEHGNKNVADLLASSLDDGYKAGMGVVFDNGDFDVADILNYNLAIQEAHATYLNHELAKNQYELLTKGNPKDIRDLIMLYRKALQESYQAQQESERAARQGKEADTKKYSSIKNWLAEATNQQIGEKINELDNNLTNLIKQFNEFVNGLPDGDKLKLDLTKALQFAGTLSESSNNSKSVLVNTLRMMVQDLLRLYDNKLDPNVKQANDLLLELWEGLLDMDNLNQEAAARSYEHPVLGKYTTKNGKPIRVDSDTYTDDEGNLYNVDLDNSTYSENNGLTLRLTKKHSNAELQKKLFDESLKQLEKGKKELEEDLNDLYARQFHGEDVSDELIDAYKRQLDLTNRAIAETQLAKQNLDVDATLDVKYGDELLDKLYKLDNQGNKTTLNEAYKVTSDRLTEEAKQRRSKRASTPGLSSIQYNEVLNITATRVRAEIGDIEAMTENSEITRAVAYSLGDTNSKRAAAILGSPYYQAKYWSGFFAYTMDESEVDSWTTVPESRKKAAKEAIKKFNKLVQQVAYLKSVGNTKAIAKFLDDATDMLTEVPVDQQKNSDYIVLDSADPEQPDYSVKVTREELMNIIKFLPVKAYLRNPRYNEGKSYVPLVVLDLKGDTQAYSEDGKFSKKFLWRFELAKVLLQNAHMRKKDNEAAETQLDTQDVESDEMQFDTNSGYDDTAERESKKNRKSKPYATTVSIPTGSVDITFEKYNQKLITPQFDPEARIFYDANGRRMARLPQDGILTTKAVTQAHTESLQEAMVNRDHAALYSKFAQKLSDILGSTVTVELLEKKYGDTDLTVLEHVILQGILYGDGVILRDSFANATVSDSKLFDIKYTSTATKNQSVEKNKRIDDLFNLIQDEFPEEFYSFNNPNLQKATKSIVTAAMVDRYLELGLFSRTGNRKDGQPGGVRILIKDDDETWRVLGNQQSPVHTDSKTIADILNALDNGIDLVSTPQQFFDEILSKFDNIEFQYTPDPTRQSEYTTEQKKAFAMELISNYIRNRKFGRLTNQSSLTDALISGSATPKNSSVANRRFFAKLEKTAEARVVNSNIDLIDSLHIVESDGVFYFDLPSFANRSVRYAETDDSGRTVSVTDVEAELKLVDATRDLVYLPLWDLLYNTSSKKLTIKTIMDFMNNHYSTYSKYESTKGFYDEETHEFKLVDEKGKRITKKKEVLDAFNAILDLLDEEFKNMRNRVEAELLDQIKKTAADTDELSNGGKRARVLFAVGSYSDATGSASVLRDDHGTTVPMRGVQGTPGAVYLILPAWMSPSGKHRIVHLNNRKLSVQQAAFIGRLLDAVRRGLVNYTGSIPTNLIPGFNIKTNVTVEQLLSTLINIGIGNLENDRSGRAISNLLFVDKDQQVHFGTEILNDTNLNDLIQFLQDKKAMRVDRSKLLSENATVGVDATIELTDDSEFLLSGVANDKSVFSLTAGEQYQHYVVSKGVLRSDLNPDKGARMFNNTILAINTSFTGNKAIPNPGNSKKAGSAANALKKVTNEGWVAKEDFVEAMKQPAQPATATPLATTEVIPYDKESLRDFITKELGTSGFTPIKKSGEDTSLDALLKGIQMGQKAGYKKVTFNFKLDDGTLREVKIPLRQEVKQAPAQATAAPILILPAHTPASPWAAPPAYGTAKTPGISLGRGVASPLNAPETHSKPRTDTLTGTGKGTIGAKKGTLKTPENASQSILTRLMSAIATDPKAFNTILTEIKDDDDTRFKEFLMKYALNKLGIKADDLLKLNNEIATRIDELITLKNRYKEATKNPPFYGSILNFLDKYVEKEDYQKAQARAIRILGNPQIKFTSDLPFTYDSNRRAFIYVFGQCSEAFMHIYRSAKGQVAAGVMDHEAFHKISLFVLSAKERKQLYEDIRAKYSETKDMSDQQVEEFAADLFKDFVNKYEKQGVEGFYSDNKLVAFFLKLYDYGTKMLRKIFGLRTQPSYRGIQRLFEDMYTGRYAYAKATKDNAEMFNILYHDAPFSGIKSLNGNTVVAKNSTEHTKIIRTILANIVANSKLLDTVHNSSDLGKVFDVVKLNMQSTLDGLTQAMITALANGDVTTYLRLENQQRVYKMVLNDDAWADYVNRIEDMLRREFKLERDRSNPNQLIETLEDNETDEMDSDTDNDIETSEESDLEEDDEDDNSGMNLGFSEERDSLQRNMWKSADLSTKILFWVIPQETIAGNKLNYMGLADYANPAQMFIKFTELLQNCSDEQLMLEVLKEAGEKDGSVQAVYEYLTQDDDPEVNQALQNRFFTATCRYRHNFENNTYEVETNDKGGVTEVTGRSYNGNMNETTTKVRYTLIRLMVNALISRISSSRETKYNSTTATKAKAELLKAINNLNGIIQRKLELVKRLTETLKLFYDVDGFGMFVEGDYDLSQSVDMVMSYIWDNLQERVDQNNLRTFQNILGIIKDNLTGITSDTIEKDLNDVRGKINKLVDENVELQNFLKNISMYAPRLAKMMSQNGPKGVRIYTIGAYNYITRLFLLWTKSFKNTISNWSATIRNNPYARHSVWRNGISRAKLNTRLQTMTSDNFNSAKSDKYVSPEEEMINRMVTVLQVDSKGKWLGGHAFPVLANKKFSADLTNLVIAELETPVTTLLTATGSVTYKINEGAKKLFAGYFLDELAAIKQAKETRDNFIKVINEVNGTNYTAESFSELSIAEQTDLLKASNSESLLGLARINEALNTLVVTYHFKSTKNEPVYDNKGRIVSFNTSHIDLREGSGYGHRHFSNVAAKLTKKGVDLDKLDVDNQELLAAIELEMLIPGIEDTEKAIHTRGAFNFIPTNLIKSYRKVLNLDDSVSDTNVKQLMTAIFTIRHMSDMLEYEKLVQGDMAFYGKGGSKYKKTIDGMTKRYSGPVSTFGLNASKGTRPLSLSIDSIYDLQNESEFKSLTILTTKIVDYDVFEGLLTRSLGIPVKVTYTNDIEAGEVIPTIDSTQLLDENGRLRNEVLNGAFKDYAVFREAVDGEFDAATDAKIAEKIVEDALNRYTGYLSQDYTDATSYISSTMFRELKQRSDDGWSDVEEACWLFMEHYDLLHEIYANRNINDDWDTIVKAAHLLGIDDLTLDGFRIDSDRLYNRKHQFNSEDNWNSSEHRELRAEYRGKILSYLEDEKGIPKIDTTPMKYLYYGNKPLLDATEQLYIPIYDKTALVPLFKIFTEDHGAESLYSLMRNKNIQFTKFDSTTKSGGGFSYQLYDKNGNFNTNLNTAPVQLQYFNQLSKQLDTDAHTNPNSTLLTQLTKISMLNTVNQVYQLAGQQISGTLLNLLYASAFNSLTKDGFDRFKREFGFGENTLLDADGRRKLAAKLRKILEDSGASQAIVSSIDVDENGDFITTPAILPNSNQVQSRLLSQIGKIIVDTHIKGLPLYQVVSAGFDKDHPNRASFDPELLSPGDIDANGNVVKRMLSRVSILLFNDIINEAKKNKVLSAKYNGLNSFYDKRRFLLDNKDKLPILSYRVPTQSQDSTIPVDIVDILPSTQGAIIQLPTTLTALTGADFDIDKMYTAVYNYRITDNGIEKVSYTDKYSTIDELIAHMDELSTEQKENLLLDIYQEVLTSESNLLHTTVPLDVCTSPVKNVMTKEVKVEGDNNTHDGFSLTPAHLVQMREQNSNSDTTIGPMALNSVFQYFLQTCNLDFIQDPQLSKLGLNKLGSTSLTVKESMRIAYILDITSAMINASVDAAKDNYIGRSNVNSGTYDVINFLIACGFDLNTFRFIAQPGVKGYVRSLLRNSKDAIFRVLAEREVVGEFKIKPELFTTEKLRELLNNPTDEVQNYYRLAFAYFQSVAQRYRQAISVAQVDTKKYGKNIAELMSFLQNVDDYESVYNLLFSNPLDLFENSFLKEKLNAIRDAMDMFGGVFLENSQLFKDASTKLCELFDKRGPYSKQFLRRAIPKLKLAIFKIFFDQYIVNRFSSPDGSINYSPLYTLFCDPKQSVIARYDRIKQLCEQEHNIGAAFFDAIKYTRMRKDSKEPKFFVVNSAVTSDANLKLSVQDAITEMFLSTNPEVRQWITDVAVMQFYLTGGTDTSSGAAVKSTFYDLLPILELGNIQANMGNGVMTTFNDFIKSGEYYSDLDSLVNETVFQLSISDDEYVPLLKTFGKANSYGLLLVGDESVAVLRKFSNKVKRDPRGARYAKYIKIQTRRDKSPTLYVLGNVVKSTAVNNDTGEVRVYFNPVYFRMNKLGYRQYGNISNSIRVDGAVFFDENGTPYRRSLFNKPKLVLMSDNRLHPFTATSILDLNDVQQQLNGMKLTYNASKELDAALTRGGAKYEVFAVDESGNVLYDIYNDPYRGYFDTYNHKGTQMVLTRLGQSPSEENAEIVTHAKDVGATFQQLVRDGDGYKFIGSKTELQGEVSLLVNSTAEVPEATELIFARYPNVTSIRYVDTSTGEVLSIDRNTDVRKAEAGNVLFSDRYTRVMAENNPDLLYIFTDNTDRTSQGSNYGEGWYKEKYGEGGYGSRNNQTTAVVRGLSNAAPISTMKWFYKKHNVSVAQARWTDADIEEVKRVVDSEVLDIMNLWKSGNFRAVVLPNADFLLNGQISGITQKRTPKLYEYFKSVLDELIRALSGDPINSLVTGIENNRESEEQRNKEC